MLSLYRLIDINMGSVVLDGVDTASIALDCLRKQLAIIPQVGVVCTHIWTDTSVLGRRRGQLLRSLAGMLMIQTPPPAFNLSSTIPCRMCAAAPMNMHCVPLFHDVVHPSPVPPSCVCCRTPSCSAAPCGQT